MKNEVLQQEKTYSFESFNNNDAYKIGQIIVSLVERNNLKPVRIRIVYNNDVVFQYMMEGKTGDMWLNLKQHIVEEYKHSGYYLFLESQDSHIYDHLTVENGYALCGGSFPLIVNNEYKGCILVSGLAHEEDHQLIVDALKEYTL